MHLRRIGAAADAPAAGANFLLTMGLPLIICATLREGVAAVTQQVLPFEILEDGLGDFCVLTRERGFRAGPHPAGSRSTEKKWTAVV
jgi:hypothetical protein